MHVGNVPTDRFGPIVDALVRDRWPHGDGVATLAEKVGCDVSALEGIIAGVHEGVGFDLADCILCSVGRVDIWRGQLADVYLEMELLETCAAEGCTTRFHPGVDSLGRLKKQKYCSLQCNQSAYKMRMGRTKRRLRAAHRDFSKTCRNGHPRTEANTKQLYNGNRTCRICWNAHRRKKGRMTHDSRDPAALGERLLHLTASLGIPATKIMDEVICDSGVAYEPGERMSSDPAKHHSKTPQDKPLEAA